LSKEKTSVFAPGEHGTTFGGNPLACAAGYAVTKYLIEKDVAGNADKMGKYLIKKLKDLQKKHPVIIDVRGAGLLIGVEFSKDIAEAVMYACLERGLVINFLKANLLRVIPPLVITKTDVDEGMEILDKALTSLKY
jgi:acetylornithine/N-succinyldiaminopimelate aminotransferase